MKKNPKKLFRLGNIGKRQNLSLEKLLLCQLFHCVTRIINEVKNILKSCESAIKND